MDPRSRRTTLPSALLLLIAVPVVLLLSFLALFALNTLVRVLSAPGSAGGDVSHDPASGGVPVSWVRWGLAITLMVIYLIVERTRLPDLVKAIMLSAPVGVVTASLLVSLYDQPLLALGSAALVGVLTGIFLRVTRRPWMYYFAAAFAFALATAYGWPRF